MQVGALEGKAGRRGFFSLRAFRREHRRNKLKVYVRIVLKIVEERDVRLTAEAITLVVDDGIRQGLFKNMEDSDICTLF